MIFLQAMLLTTMVLGGIAGISASILENSVGILISTILIEGLCYLALKGTDY